MSVGLATQWRLLAFARFSEGLAAPSPAVTGELTPTQADYFRVLERMDISDKFRASLQVTKAELRAENTEPK